MNHIASTILVFSCIMSPIAANASGGDVELDPVTTKIELLFSRIVLDLQLGELGEDIAKLSLVRRGVSYDVDKGFFRLINDPSIGGLSVLTVSRNGKVDLRNPDSVSITFEYGDPYDHEGLEQRKMVRFVFNGLSDDNVICIRYRLALDVGRSGWVKMAMNKDMVEEEENFFEGSARPEKW